MTPFLISVLLTLSTGLDAPQRDRDAGLGFPETPDLRVLMVLSRQVPADTILAGQTYITSLPDSLNGHFVVHLRGVSLPAYSWLVQKSFFWRTSTRDRGDHEFWFRAVLDDERVDSLAVRVRVE